MEKQMDYLAFDFGDGTTCAAHYDNSFAAYSRPPEELSILPGVKEIWSVIGYDGNGENPYIGSDASQVGYTIRANWKAKPSLYEEQGPDAWKRTTAIEFMRIVFDNFLANNPDYTHNGVHNGNPYKVVLGVPCDWCLKDIKAYREMANDAGIPNVDVVKESQAAMFFARRFMRQGIPDEDIRNGVLLVDIGSSTTDFTFMRGADQVGHCGLALGARAVECSFLCEARKRGKFCYWSDGPRADGWKILAPNQTEGERMYDYEMMKCREYKEKYFKGVDQRQDYTAEVLPLKYSDVSIGEVRDGKGYITKKYGDYCLNDSGNSPCKFKLKQLSKEWKGAGLDADNTWRGHFRAALSHVKDKWNLNSSVSIVVTGGASRMQFVENDIIDVFGPSKKPYFGSDGARSFSVVMGLAWCGFARDQIAKKRQELEKLFGDPGAIEKLGIDKFVDNLLSQPAEDIATEVRVKLCEQLKGHDNSVNTIKKIRDKYSELVCLEWNKLIKTLNGGINVKEILDSEVLNSLTTAIYESFGRPEIKISTDVTAAFQYSICEAGIRFDPLAGVFWRPADDVNFDSCSLDKYGPAEVNCRRNITTNMVLEGHFKSQLAELETGKPVPSFCRQLCNAVFRRVQEFKLAEIDKLSGALEYGQK